VQRPDQRQREWGSRDLNPGPTDYENHSRNALTCTDTGGRLFDLRKLYATSAIVPRCFSASCAPDVPRGALNERKEDIAVS